MKKAILILMLSTQAHALTCDKNCYPYNGICACDAPTVTVQTVNPDNVKPRQEVQTEWEIGLVNVVNAPNLRDQDEAQDKAKVQADADGKKAAKIPAKKVKETK